MPNANFTLKLTRDEANDVAESLRVRLAALTAIPYAEMTGEQQHQAGRIEALLRWEF